MRDEYATGLIDEIIKLEWDMFSNVSNVGRSAACQLDPITFAIMRRSQQETWSEPLLRSYLEDLRAAERKGRNLMSEKYAWMMETTFPEEFLALKDRLPQPAPRTLPLIEEIVAVNVAWKRDLATRFPNLNSRGRPLRTAEDSLSDTSFETYLRGELKTYSLKTLHLLHELTMSRKREGVNDVERNLLNQVRHYGFTSLEEVEKRQAASGR